MVRRILDFDIAHRSISGKTPVWDHLKQETHVKVKLGDVLPALADALHSQRVWVQDFQDDQIELSKDLLEVIQAYQQVRNVA